MTIKECYEKLEGNYDDARMRLISDSLVSRFVQKFPSDPSMQLLRDAVAAGNIKESFRAVHTLKGVTVNLGFSRLYRAAWALTEQLRQCDAPADPELYKALNEEYDRTIAILKEYSDSVN